MMGKIQMNSCINGTIQQHITKHINMLCNQSMAFTSGKNLIWNQFTHLVKGRVVKGQRKQGGNLRVKQVRNWVILVGLEILTLVASVVNKDITSMAIQKSFNSCCKGIIPTYFSLILLRLCAYW
ncbi:hypothetical protein PTKIN_Ptkin12aG0013500 [Pterospermum kingtungense]